MFANHDRRRGTRAWQRYLACAVAVLGCVSMTTLRPADGSPARADLSQTKAFQVTRDYMVEFYPLWFTWFQSQGPTNNHLAGPVRVSPLYQIVVAINVDTLYASGFLNLSSDSLVLTIPSTSVRYSILGLDPYGNIFDTGIVAGTSGAYALTGPGFGGKLPKKLTPTAIPYQHAILIFRADKYSGTGQDQQQQAEQFRKSLKLQPLKAWIKDPNGAPALILPELGFAKPFKTVADVMVATNALKFLEQLQTAVEAPNTPPMTARQKALSDEFNALFAARKNPAEFSAGAKAAHAAILQDYLGHIGKTQWIHFLNIGHWSPDESLDRSAITEFIQYGNDIRTAAYYQTFNDETGAPLNGANAQSYVLQIPKDQIPQAQRFWSFTAYTPQSIELVRNAAKKYVVASYTPGLKYNADGSLTITIANQPPAGTTAANWLPAPNGPFNVMLRVYGPQGSVANDTYVPPAIRKP